jgi:histidinol-phosphate aminotransferase
VNRAAQAGALAALDDTEFVQRTLHNNREGREQLYRALDEMDITYRRSQSNFVMIDLGRPAEPVFQAMLRDGIIVRPLASFGMPNGLRISVGTRADNERAIAALKKALAK